MPKLNLKEVKESEKALAYESSENAFASDLEIAAKMMAKKKMANTEPGTWSSGLDFFMSSLGYAVGIGKKTLHFYVGIYNVSICFLLNDINLIFMFYRQCMEVTYSFGTFYY